jgi:hypothetical protein
MPLTMRPTGLGSGIDRTGLTTLSFPASGISVASTRPARSYGFMVTSLRPRRRPPADEESEPGRVLVRKSTEYAVAPRRRRLRAS